MVRVEVGVRAQAGRRHPSVLHPRRRVRRRQVQQVARLQLRRQRVGHGAKVEQPSVVALGARAPLAPRRRRSRVVAPTRRRHVALRRLQRTEERVGAPVGCALRRVQPRPQRGRRVGLEVHVRSGLHAVQRSAAVELAQPRPRPRAARPAVDHRAAQQHRRAARDGLVDERALALPRQRLERRHPSERRLVADAGAPRDHRHLVRRAAAGEGGGGGRAHR